MARSRISAIWWNRCYLELVIKNNATLTFPVCITLIAGCLIAREDTDGTLKSLLVIPISLRSLAGGKLLLCALLSLLFGAAGAAGAAFTLLGELAAGFPGVTLPLIAQACLQIPAQRLLLYLAMLPVIVGAARLGSGAKGGSLAAFVYGYGILFAAGVPRPFSWYPPSATLGILQYRAYASAVRQNIPACLRSLILSAAVSLLLLMGMRTGEPKQAAPPKAARNCQKGLVNKKTRGSVWNAAA